MIHKQTNVVLYHILMLHINHYRLVKQNLKIDYDSHMIVMSVLSNILYGNLNPSHKKYLNENLEWNTMFPVVKNLTGHETKYKKKLSLFALGKLLNIPKESVRRKVSILCKKKYLNYSIKKGLQIGNNLEKGAAKVAPKDLMGFGKVVKAVNENGGLLKIVKQIKKVK